MITIYTTTSKKFTWGDITTTCLRNLVYDIRSMTFGLWHLVYDFTFRVITPASELEWWNEYNVL